MTDPNRPRGKPLFVGLALAAAVSAGWTGYWLMIKPGSDTASRRPPSPAAMEIDERDQRLVTMGEPLYATNCASCHGADMEGQADWQRRLPNGRLPAPPHDETGHTWHHPDSTLFDIVKYGTAALLPVDYETDMGGYEDILTDAEIRAVLAYIKSRWPDDIRDRHRQMTEAARQ
ncbi:cytochrome c [uncultured Maricaulis sp.]|uniref:c-type cytochrome n=1 Tax=uncultured Maricaulis sp. TaxID=174710 RepID=UPI0030DD078D|tara:strand:- start:1416 stop:1937 length:522 start_codon:yes stop_codon:yes gene_type:complete